MESLGKDHAYSDPSLPPSTAREEYAVPGVTTRRLRDRELLRKRKAEAQEKDSIQWALGREQEKSKRQRRRRRGAGRGQGRQPVVQPTSEPEPEPDPQPPAQEEAELVLPKPAHRAQPPVLAMQELLGGTQMGALEGELASGSQDPLGEEEVLKPAEEIPEDLNTPLENDTEDSEYFSPVLF